MAAMDSVRAARLLKGVRDAALSGHRPPVDPRPVIEESWSRVLRRGVDPDRDVRARLLSLEELEERRRTSPLAEVLPELRRGLVSIADAAQHIMVVADTEGRILWREGAPAVLRMADSHGFELGADWRESMVGTNGVGTPLVARRPVQVFSAEHFVRTHHNWTCAGSPVTDPRDGRLIGVVDVSGPLDTMHPATLALVNSVTRLAEAELRTRHLSTLDRLRTTAVPLLAGIPGRAVVVDGNGWTAAVTGMAPTGRLALPKSFGPGRTWLPSLGSCQVDPLPGGWLLRPDDTDGTTAGASAVVVLDLSSPRHPTVSVSGEAGSWTHELTPRHAELLYLLAVAPAGRTASALAGELFGDAGRAVTVRAELSRVRRYLAGLLDGRPYRFREGTDVRVILPQDPADLLPQSLASTVVRARRGERG
ncbi:GAF domain-containing protein [Streptomyces sp. TRM66268-LWL]|uniref:GAF domain-containing protein n=1 Tax=Streptomyces polyasparticus TaxID=2767826 RepID=A0ABR7SDR1_9ACTN|nr:GAF domain-containing protein [Streptomyces polyasparticus]MBC9713004.1 GAF domain-containing protein [Streptomyces polyasparticus]